MKKRKISFIIIFLVGISLLLYPRIGNIITSFKQKSSIESYKKTISTIDKKKNEKLYEEAVKYNETIYSYRKIKKRYNLDNEYKKILKVNNNDVMGYIEIPKVKVKLPIYHDVEDSVLQLGVGHLKESSLPIGTTNQNSLLMGHSGLPVARIFSNLERLKKSDYITIKILNKKYYYKIINIEVVKPKEVYDKMIIEEGKSLITLVTCTPYGINSHRLVITSEKIDKIPKSYDSKVDPAIYYNSVDLIIGIIILIMIIIGLFLYKKSNNKLIGAKNNVVIDKDIKKDKIKENNNESNDSNKIKNNESNNSNLTNNKKKKKRKKKKNGNNNKKGNKKNNKRKKKKH